jgi:hypothetical protein
MPRPTFLKYYCNCSNGNKTCVNNETLANNSQFCNLKIPANTTVNVTPALRTVIYVKDTLFLYGTIMGSGTHTSVTTTNTTVNHVGATASHFNVASWSTEYTVGSGNSVLSLTWTANQLPSSYYQQFNNSITKTPGSAIGQIACPPAQYNGQSLSSQNLMELMHFGTNISGGNGQATGVGSGSCQKIAYGGQGGAGLYIIANNIIFNGSIILNGGNGMYVVASCQPAYQASSAGGGAGSCIISTENVISQTGTFQATGGNAGYTACNGKGGNGAMIIVKP